MHFHSRYLDDELFKGPQDDGMHKCILEACSATSVYVAENICYGTRLVKNIIIK